MKRLIEVLLIVLFGRPRTPPWPWENPPGRRLAATSGRKRLRGFRLDWPGRARRTPGQGFPGLAHRQRREQLSSEPLMLLDAALVDLSSSCPRPRDYYHPLAWWILQFRFAHSVPFTAAGPCASSP